MTILPAVIDPVASEFVSRIGEYVVTKALSSYRRRRAEGYFEAFAGAIRLEDESGIETPTVDQLFTRIQNDETAAELLAEGYRRVCMSASRNLGPKIIGLLTAELFTEGRLANETEERWFLAAEQLSDTQLVWLKTNHQHAHNEKTSPMSPGHMARKGYTGPALYTTSSGGALPLSVSRLEQLGIVGIETSSDVRSVYTYPEVASFVALILRAQGPVAAGR